MPRTEPSRSRHAELVARFGQIVRETLATGSGRSALDAVLEAVAEEIGCDAVGAVRLEDDRLVLHARYGYDPDLLPTGEQIPVGTGIVGEAARTGEPVYTTDGDADPRWVDVSGGRLRCGCAVPMWLPDRLWGVLIVESEQVDAFDAATRDAIRPLADLLAWALESLRLRHDAEDRAAAEAALRQDLEASAAIVTAGLEASSVDDVMGRMTREMHHRLGWERIAVLLLQDDGTLRLVSSHGLSEHAEQRSYPAGLGVVGHVAVTGETHRVDDVEDDPYYREVVSETRAELAVPLVVAGVVRGVVNVESDTPGRFGPAEQALLERLAGQMSLVLHNVELLRSEKDTVARLHEFERLKSRLLTMASHELRTPLTVVLGFSEVLSENLAQLQQHDVAHYADAIARQARSLSKLVDHMLIAAEIEQGTVNVVPARVDLGELVRSIAAGFPEADIQLGPGLDAEPVRADPFRLRQVIENLVSNAVKYASDGVIQLDAKSTGGIVTLLVRDEGPGIPGAEHEKVFEVFHQHGEHGVAGRRGVGLGLAVARDLIRLMDGELRLASAEGYGATFLITLPRG